MRYCYKGKYDSFEVNDALDISDGDRLIGIEVAEGQKPGEGKGTPEE
ncbi:hypothetical protein [Bacteroides congonensis]